MRILKSLSRHRHLLPGICLVLALFVVISVSSRAAAEAVTVEDGKVTLLNAIIEHTDWPDQDRIDRYIIGLYGRDTQLLRAIKRAEPRMRAHGKPVVGKYYSSLFEARSAHVLVLANSKNSELVRVNQILQKSNTLIVTDGSDDQRNIMINFTHPTDNILSFEVNRSNIVFEGLQLSKEILLFGGTELDAATIYKETEAELAKARDLANQQQQELEAQQKLLAQQMEKIRQQSVQVAKKEQQLAELEQHFNRVQASLEQSEMRLLDNEIALRQNEAALQQKEAVLSEKEASIAGYSRKIEENQARLAKQQAELQEQERLIAEKNTVLTKQVSTIEYQKLILIAGSVALLVVLVLIGIIFRSYRSKHKINLQLKDKTSELEAANEKLRMMTDAKSQFLSTMSHEIRTPMNGVIGMAELLEGTKLTNQQAEYVALILNSADTLLDLINDILDFSKIEAGKLDLEVIPFNLPDVLGDTLQTLALRANEKGLELAFHIPPDVPERVCGDPVRLRQVVVNLVGNAIKFTERGEIVVDLHLESLSTDAARIAFDVRDTGVGISAEQREKIFEAFGQADSSTTRQYGGTGLGLAIASQLATMMGGQMTLTSEPGRGSTFSFSADFALPATEGTEPVKATDLQGQRVLIVDDNSTNRMILEEIVENWGMQACVVDSGARALAELDHAASKAQSFALALLDLMMPGMDGVELVRKIRQQPVHRDMRILILSSAGSSGAGFSTELDISRTLLKPVKHSDLLVAVTDALGVATAEPKSAPVSRERPEDVPASRVLLVEDGVINQKVATDLLTKRGHSVELAQNGQEALDALERESFDVVLMDVQMPVMDGITATCKIRERESRSGGHVPIVAMTASATTADRERCFAAGMDDYVTKPFRTAELFRAVEENASGQAASPSTAAARPGAEPGPEPQATTAAQPEPIAEPEREAEAGAEPELKADVKVEPEAEAKPEPKPEPKEEAKVEPEMEPKPKQAASGGPEKTAGAPRLDWAAALANLEGDEALLIELAQLFLEQCPKLMASIESALAAQDGAELRRAAHTLKGSANVVGGRATAAAALALENLAREGQFEAAAPAREALVAQLALLEPLLRKVVKGASAQEGG
ncbi:MAG: DUF4154 domain-containing protein [Gammaproteobacteria bacterium]|uniref:YfiR/HmsC family protein n=1 Tax=Pseudomaricurvus alcaniphilus TaxID=1166482 RepID=UPI00140E5DF4|nr:YfiR/HmsC family protein [Pseudomaricurvus alcaniphilus]MBR9908738.1 DUF4154 domain-containing protein [Gammaproteobacteria bacterium]NHN37833.1 DUF4154 domain-containing protein [Pseudomaricurvus alcaniphilus]